MAAKQYNKFFFIILLTFLSVASIHAEDEEKAPPPPNPNAINESILTYFDTDEDKLNKRLDDFLVVLTQIEALNNKKFNATISKIKLGLKSLAATGVPDGNVIVDKPAFLKSYRLLDLINLHHAIRKNRLDLRSIVDAQKENKSQLEAASNNFDRELEFYKKMQPDTPEKIESGLETLYYLILTKIAERKEKIYQLNKARAEIRLKNFEEELAFAKTHLAVNDSDLLAMKQDIKFFKHDWLETKNTHQERESDLILDNQESSIQQEILKSALKELSAKQKLISSELRYALASLIHPSDSFDVSKMNQKIVEWEQDLRSLRQTTENLIDKQQLSMQRYGEMLTLSVSSPAASSEAYSLAQDNLLTLQTLQSNIDDSEFLISLIKENTNLLQGSFYYYLSSLWNHTLKGLFYIKSYLDTTILHIGLTPVTYWGILRFLTVIILTLFTSRFLIRALSHYAIEKKKVQRSVVYRLGRLLHYSVLSAGVLLALSSIGFDFSNLLLVAGALGVGLGFGLQSIFNNFISGIIMLFESHLRIGDFIEVVPGIKGEIREINVRTTLLTTPDGVEVIVPNADMISSKINNWTFRHTYRRLHIAFSVAYGSDLKLVQKVVLELAKQMPDTLLKLGFDEPQVIVTKLAESSIDFEVNLWVSKIKASTQSDYLIAITEVLQQNGIEQPLPQRDLNIRRVLKKDDFNLIKNLLSR
ncbi:MAG: mechanosensitive ion channel family protein [Parachlamydiaceae bacterium]